MSHRKLNSFILIAACALGLAACKEDEDSTVLPSLDGTLNFQVPEYVAQKAVVKMTPNGVSHPDGEGIGYCWEVETTMPDADTTRFENGLDRNGNPSDGSITFTFSDTTKTYSISCIAFAEDYTSSSKTKSSTVVKGGVDGSITGLGLTSAQKAVIAGKTYHYVTVGDIDWMCRNIEDPSAGVPYMNCKAMSDVFGRYYTYEEALGICPEGWELPADADWTALAKHAGADDADEAFADIKGVAAALMGDAYFNDAKMWEFWPEVGKLTNSTGISMIPAGFVMMNHKETSPKDDGHMEYTYPNAQFKGYEKYAAFWTADSVQEEEGMAYYRYVVSTQPDFFLGKTSTTSFGASVRCIRKK